jgi:16S rRNA G966 N2-methylase RsmD
MKTHLDLFSGIGGFALAAQWAGFTTIAFSEIDPYANQILKKHWPATPNLGDIRGVTAGTVADLLRDRGAARASDTQTGEARQTTVVGRGSKSKSPSNQNQPNHETKPN